MGDERIEMGLKGKEKKPNQKLRNKVSAMLIPSCEGKWGQVILSLAV